VGVADRQPAGEGGGVEGRIWLPGPLTLAGLPLPTSAVQAAPWSRLPSSRPMRKRASFSWVLVQVFFSSSAAVRATRLALPAALILWRCSSVYDSAASRSGLP
jgi:hypothetical protein